MRITKRRLRRIIKESLINEQTMWHSTAPENVEAILSQGLQTGRESANTIAGAWADEFYGTRPIYLSVQKGKYEGQPLAVNVSGLGLVADLPTLVDTGAYQEEEGMYWDEGSEPAQMMDIVDEDGMVYFDELLSPGSDAAQAAIDLTGTAAVVQDIPSKSISTEEGDLKSSEPSAAESKWASKSQEDKDAHWKNAAWETMAWKRYRKHAQAEGIPFDPDNEKDMTVARAWWKEQPESRQFEGKVRITERKLRRIIRSTLLRESADLDSLFAAATKEMGDWGPDPAGIPSHKGGEWGPDDWMEYLYEAEAEAVEDVDATIKYVKAVWPEHTAAIDEMFSEAGPRTLDPVYEAFADLIDGEDYTGDPIIQADTAPGAIKVSPIYEEPGASRFSRPIKYRWWLFGNNIEPLPIDINSKGMDKDDNVYSAEELFQQITGGKESRFKVPRSWSE